MIIPAIHPKGSGRKELLRQAEETVEALDKAIKAMEAACPRQCDYEQGAENRGEIALVAREFLPEPDHAFKQAVLEHEKRIHNIAKMLYAYETLLKALEDPKETAKRL